MGVEKPKPSLEEIANLVEANIEGYMVGPFSFCHPDYNFVTKLGECSQEVGFKWIKLYRWLECSEDGRELRYLVKVSLLPKSLGRKTIAEYKSKDKEWNSEAGKRVERLIEHLISEWSCERVLEEMGELIATVRRKKLCWNP